MTNTILLISTDNEFIEQVPSVGNYGIQVDNTLPIALADVLLCIVDVATVTVATDWVVENAEKTRLIIAFNNEHQIAAFLNLAVADFWMKPIHSIELRSRIRNLVNSRHFEDGYRNQTTLMYFVLREISNALVPIRGYSDFLLTSELKDNLTEQQLKILSIILANAKAIQTILHDHRDTNLDAP